MKGVGSLGVKKVGCSEQSCGGVYELHMVGRERQVACFGLFADACMPLDLLSSSIPVREFLTHSFLLQVPVFYASLPRGGRVSGGKQEAGSI